MSDARRQDGPGAATAARADLSADLKRSFAQASTLFQSDDLVAADGLFHAIVRKAPDHAESLYFIGLIAFGRNQFKRALAHFDRVLALEPGFLPAHLNRGNALQGLNRYVEAIDSYRRAATLAPRNVFVLYFLGNALWQVGRYEEAKKAYESALALEPGYTHARFARCMAELKIVYASEDDVAACRKAYAAQLADLVKRGAAVKVDGTLPQPFYLPYQGQNDRALQASFGAFVRERSRERHPDAPLPPPPGPDEPIRVGIVSGFFRKGHAIWKIPLKGWVTQLDRKRFRLFCYDTGSNDDEATAATRRACERFVTGKKSVAAWRGEILADAPHVLLYPEIGMDGIGAALAAQRLAPVQCNALGHPETSGLPSVDYYLSSALMEGANAQDFYTETLIRLPNLSVHLDPVAPVKERNARGRIGVPQGALAFWCGQSFYKFLPRNDWVFPKIARGVGPCKFVFVQHRKSVYANDDFKARLRRAFAQEGRDADDYCIYLPQQEQEEFIAATGASDVYLDSLDWAGFNSALEAIAHDLPIVTLPRDTLRSRHAVALLTMMGVDETVAATPEDYVALAVRLAKDPAWRAEVRAKIARNKHRLYGDKRAIAGLERFMEIAARKLNVGFDALGDEAA